MQTLHFLFLLYNPLFINRNAFCNGTNKNNVLIAVQASWGNIKGREDIKYARAASPCIPYQSGVNQLSNRLNAAVHATAIGNNHQRANNGFFTQRPKRPKRQASNGKYSKYNINTVSLNGKTSCLKRANATAAIPPRQTPKTKEYEINNTVTTSIPGRAAKTSCAAITSATNTEI